MSEIQKFPSGSYIFREGESAQYAYVLQSGTIEILKLGADGEAVIAELNEKGKIFGEMALIDEGPRSAGAKAKTDVEVTGVDKTTFMDYVAQNPQAAHNIMVKLSGELRHANFEITQLASRTSLDSNETVDNFNISEQQHNDDVDDTDAIYDTPPSKLVIYAGGLILALFVVAFTFSSIFEVDTTVSSRGEFTTKVPNVDVQSTSNAIVKAVLVERGQILKQGQVVAILDEVDAETNLKQNVETLSTVKDKLHRIELEQNYIRTSTPIAKIVLLPNMLADILRKRVDQYRSKLTSFSYKISKLENETKSASETVRITKRQTALKRQIEKARKALYSRQNGSLLSYLQAQDATLQSERSFYDAKNLLALKKTDLSVLQADKEEFTASWSSSLGEARSKEEEKRIQLVQASVKLRRDMRNVEVRAPVDGIVLDLPKVSSGSIVKQGEVIATLVRLNQPLTLEVDISPKDVSDVRIGSSVSVKLDALPFQQYGDLDGTLSYMSQDTYDKDLAGEKASVYRGRVSIPLTELTGLPKGFKLTSGMTASADMKVGKRRLITYLLHPIIKGLSQSFTEPD
jgi:hemolysin D